ncbi:coil containing protein [Vibrio phage 1.081.O._10N.286.52.C2]|nr:coil containing protein [Vibrio phage 1.081.O._10N.286.52.C2]
MSYTIRNGKLVKEKKAGNPEKKAEQQWAEQERVLKRWNERQEIDRMGTMDRHNAMYKLAERNERKGKKGGDCNVTQCQKPGASCWNPPMRAWYCYECASDIRESSIRFGDEPFIRPQDLHCDHHFKYEG